MPDGGSSDLARLDLISRAVIAATKVYSRTFHAFGAHTIRHSLLATLTLAIAFSPALSSAQAHPAVLGGGKSLWAGGEYSNYKVDFGPSDRIMGFAGFVDYNWSSRFAAEGEVRFLRFNGYQGEHQDNYLIGPKYTILRRGNFRPYAKILFGLGEMKFPYKIGSGGYFAYAPGGGLDYRITHRIALRAEYEYQLWPGAPGIADEPSHGLHPNGFSAGISYRIF
jgi:opacity protein-like surface antigen